MKDLPSLLPLVNMKFLSIKNELIMLASLATDVEVLWLYGSQANKTASEFSDVDLAIAFKTYIDDPLERRLRPELLALKWIKELKLAEGFISIVDISIAPIPLAYEIISADTVLFEVNSKRRIMEEQRISSIWEIDYQYHYKIYE